MPKIKLKIKKKILYLYIFFIIFFIFAIILFFKFSSKKIINYNLKELKYKDLPNWQQDENKKELIEIFKLNCNIYLKKDKTKILINNTTVKDIQDVCNNFNQQNITNNKDFQKFIEQTLTPYLLETNNSIIATGYHHINLKGSFKKDDVYKYPIYQEPTDLVTVNLQNFEETKDINKILYGRLENQKFIPYYTREEIENGILKNKNLEILYLTSKLDILYLQIQGSGKITLPNNKEIYIKYKSKNGHKFKGIGGILANNNYLKNNELSKEKIYNFFINNKDKIDFILNHNKSFIFFEINTKKEVIGSFLPLIKERSIAIDNNIYPYGFLFFLITVYGNTKKDFNKLVISSDTGSAIKTAERIDLYFGEDSEAEYYANQMKNKSKLYILLPKKIKK
jgi:membrane-bound lytic murein transglycosylase A